MEKTDKGSLFKRGRFSKQEDAMIESEVLKDTPFKGTRCTESII